MQYRVLERVDYDPEVPLTIMKRALSASARIARWGWRAPLRTLDRVNVLRHGRAAMSLRLIHETVPAVSSQIQYDVIHCHFGPNGNRALEMREYGALQGPIITSFHGYDVNRLPRMHGPGLYKELFKKGECFTAGSDFLLNKIIELGAPKDRVIKLPMGVDLKRFTPDRKRPRQEDELRLLSVARLVEVKGVEYGLMAVRSLQDFGLRLQYRIVGDGPLRARLEALRDQLGIQRSVEFLGARTQSEVISLYRSTDIFLLPAVVTDSHEEESQSVALAEAQASSVPVVATKVGGIAETVVDGKTGFLVSQRDPDALAASILWLAQHPEAAARMGEAGRAHVQKYFDLQKLNNQLLGLYEVISSS